MLPTIKDIKFPKFDEAQQTDARLELNHDKLPSGYGKEKKGKNNQEDVSEFIKESFSAQSLIMYIEKYIEDHLLEEGGDDVQEPMSLIQKQENFRGWYNPAHNNSNSIERKRAVLAYAQTVRTAQKNRNFTCTQANENLDDKQDLYSLNDAYRLLWDLRKLNEKGIKRLEINTNEAFIVAIENAVKATGSFL